MAYPSGMSASQPAGDHARYTWDDFVALGDEDKRELIDGELVEIEVPTFIHEHVLAELVGALHLWKQTNGGAVIASGYRVRISERRGVMPDVQFFRHDNRPTLDQDKGLAHGRRTSQSRSSPHPAAVTTV